MRNGNAIYAFARMDINCRERSKSLATFAMLMSVAIAIAWGHEQPTNYKPNN